MDYDTAYHKEQERRLNMVTEEVDTNRIDILKLKYKLDATLILDILILLILVPQAVRYIPALLKLLLL